MASSAAMSAIFFVLGVGHGGPYGVDHALRWPQSTQANFKFFNNTESATRYECLISAMIERKQTLEASD